MKKNRILLFAAMALTMTACGPKAGKIFSEDWNTPYGTAPFSKISEADYMPAILAGIEAQKAEIRAIVNNPDAPTFENTSRPTSFPATFFPKFPVYSSISPNRTPPPRSSRSRRR